MNDLEMMNDAQLAELLGLKLGHPAHGLDHLEQVNFGGGNLEDGAAFLLVDRDGSVAHVTSSRHVPGEPLVVNSHPHLLRKVGPPPQADPMES